MMETHSSLVTTWECDENGHWNVQFYFRAFQLAAEILAVRCGQPNPSVRAAICRHVRFHRELLSGDPLRIRSAKLADGELAGCIVHLLENAETGELAATSIDHSAYRTEGLEEISCNKVRAALPRGIEPGPITPVKSQPLVESKRAIVSHLDIIRPWDVDHDGALISDRIVSRFTDSATHVWNHAGISAQWLAEKNFGRVAVEMKLTRLAPITCGAATRLVSWTAEMERKTFAICHQLENLVTGEAVACAKVRCLILDLESRKATPLPDSLRETLRNDG